MIKSLINSRKSGINDGEKYFGRKVLLRCDMSISDYYDMYKLWVNRK